MLTEELTPNPDCKGGDMLRVPTAISERLSKRDAGLLEHSDARIETELRAFLGRQFLQAAPENFHAQRILVTDFLKSF